jgi:hypothetical protein
VKRELPDPGIGPQTVEHIGARKRCVHHHEERDVATICLRIGIGDHQPNIVPDHHNGARDLKMLTQQAMDIFRHGALVIPARRSRRVSRAAIIRSDDAKPGVDKRLYQAMPFPPGLRKSVQKDGGSGTRSDGHEMKPQARLDVSHRLRHTRF